ncbi:hypothetical protein DID75_02610 [Candidatus Marinamargulisbacteria bacterium SCGC AG-410-N11]|nr:hypothetical protein DID75_02610 [Candidatus Marinamargulisbacteria bacterium SCGC AG-410-N11]
MGGQRVDGQSPINFEKFSLRKKNLDSKVDTKGFPMDEKITYHQTNSDNPMSQVGPDGDIHEMTMHPKFKQELDYKSEVFSDSQDDLKLMKKDPQEIFNTLIGQKERMSKLFTFIDRQNDGSTLNKQYESFPRLIYEDIPGFKDKLETFLGDLINKLDQTSSNLTNDMHKARIEGWKDIFTTLKTVDKEHSFAAWMEDIRDLRREEMQEDQGTRRRGRGRGRGNNRREFGGSSIVRASSP